MREFFRGWRRKAGCVTLVMACNFAGGWLRTFYVGDGIDIGRVVVGSLEGSLVVVGSLEGSLVVVGSLEGSLVVVGTMEESLYFPEWNCEEPRAAKEELKSLDEIVKGWRWCGVVCGRIDALSDRGASVWIVPYVYLVVPLTLLSAYLLLSKPRQPKPPG
ncbi:hypothetical protein [Schlesneria sp. T3-172]|uniref:hypothetical protein n=1 Tax=Schlesneria sphaerica TaxID=3373610 RepID=UPI0037C7E697